MVFDINIMGLKNLFECFKKCFFTRNTYTGEDESQFEVNYDNYYENVINESDTDNCSEIKARYCNQNLRKRKNGYNMLRRTKSLSVINNLQSRSTNMSDDKLIGGNSQTNYKRDIEGNFKSHNDKYFQKYNNLHISRSNDSNIIRSNELRIENKTDEENLKQRSVQLEFTDKYNKKQIMEGRTVFPDYEFS